MAKDLSWVTDDMRVAMAMLHDHPAYKSLQWAREAYTIKVATFPETLDGLEHAGFLAPGDRADEQKVGVALRMFLWLTLTQTPGRA
jgi:hypothetical protein